MALLFCDSFDHYTTITQKWTTQANAGIQAGTGRNGTASIQMSGGATPRNAIKTLGVNAQTLIAGVAHKNSRADIAQPIFGFMDAGAWQCEVRMNATGQLQICRNGTVLATSDQALQSDIWYYIQFKAYIHDTLGTAEVNVNGLTWVTISNADTKNTANAYANQICLWNHTGAGPTVNFDDLYVCDTTGSYNNAFLGDVRVQAILPSGVGAQAEWDPSAGANWQCVDEAAPNADTDYVSTAVAGERDSYLFGDLTPVTGSIKAVVVYPMARKDDAGARSIAPVVRVGGVNYDGVEQSIADTYAYYKQIYEENPGTALPWTIADVNAAEFGVKLVA
jgi:hypothetical protein